MFYAAETYMGGKVYVSSYLKIFSSVYFVQCFHVCYDVISPFTRLSEVSMLNLHETSFMLFAVNVKLWVSWCENLFNVKVVARKNQSEFKKSFLISVLLQNFFPAFFVLDVLQFICIYFNIYQHCYLLTFSVN